MPQRKRSRSAATTPAARGSSSARRASSQPRLRDSTRGTGPAGRAHPRSSSRGSTPGEIERLIRSQPWSTLEPLVATCHDPAGALARLRAMASLIINWNRTSSNVMSRHDESRIVERHMAESLAPATWIGETGLRSWVDFGSGAGFPAIPLAVAGIGERWLLVESRRTKALFLRRVVQELESKGIAVENARLEALATPGPFGGFTARATVDAPRTLALAASLVEPGGSAFLWKGSRLGDELERDRTWQALWSLDRVMPISANQAVVARFIRTAR